MTDKTPATKTRKPQKITYPRLYNALEEIVNSAGLKLDSTISDLYVVLDVEIVKEARGK